MVFSSKIYLLRFRTLWVSHLERFRWCCMQYTEKQTCK
uniref:Uncharacterized protein n=1 Tax=Medicago truncatula TaxID=3880 RepID=I3SY03_MEDTR|nr:unknown [Medicago truncatula]